jgi:hypothetical protein
VENKQTTYAKQLSQYEQVPWQRKQTQKAWEMIGKTSEDDEHVLGSSTIYKYIYIVIFSSGDP